MQNIKYDDADWLTEYPIKYDDADWLTEYPIKLSSHDWSAEYQIRQCGLVSRVTLWTSQ